MCLQPLIKEFAAIYWGTATHNSREAVSFNAVRHLSHNFLHFKNKARETTREFILQKVTWLLLGPQAISIKWWNLKRRKKKTKQ